MLSDDTNRLTYRFKNPKHYLVYHGNDRIGYISLPSLCLWLYGNSSNKKPKDVFDLFPTLKFRLKEQLNVYLRFEGSDELHLVTEQEAMEITGMSSKLIEKQINDCPVKPLHPKHITYMDFDELTINNPRELLLPYLDSSRIIRRKGLKSIF